MYLKACAQSPRRNPGAHQSWHSGSIARAPWTAPMSHASQPTSARSPTTSALASASLPQMNIVGGADAPNLGSIITALPTQLNALTNLASGCAFWRRSMSESLPVVK
eukprot:Amastigsp_a845902_10.p4 type:complete len:107 gc:universal Amastigsp_a845902_10:688-368(-)